MRARFFCEPPVTGTAAMLAGAEAHHLLHVMRARPGDEVMLFDGSGWEFVGRIETCTRREVGLTILSRESIDREATLRITLAVALPKGDRQRVLVEKCVELGVARLVPLETEHTVVTIKSAGLEKLRRAVIEASKQCGRNRLLEISDPQPLSDFLTTADPAAFHGIADRTAPSPLSSALVADGDHMQFAIGPEGGFSDRELQQAVACDWHRFHLGTRILRIETAAIAIAACCGGCR